MIRFSSLGLLAVVVCGTWAGPARAAVTLTVDDFSQGTAVPLLSQPGIGLVAAVQGPYPAGNLVGTERETTLQVLSSEFGLTTDVNILGGLGLLNVNNASGNNSVVTTLYDGVGNAGLGGLDLTAGGGSQFQFTVVASDLGVAVTVAVADTLGNESSLTQAVPGPGILTFDFAAFVGGADFTTVNAIEIVYNAPRAADFTIDFVGVGTPVPEPTSVGLALAGAAGLGGFARRRFRKA